MNTRIRYVSEHTDTNASLVSNRTFEVNGIQYRVYLYPMDGSFAIKNSATNETVAAGNGAGENNLKIKAKKALQGLGVQFGVEGRTRAVAQSTE